MRSRSALDLRAPAAWSALASITLVLTMLAAGCPFNTAGSNTNLDGGQGIPCSNNAECADVDDNPCTINTCGKDGTCVSDNAPNGDAPEQVPNDCKKVTCSEGQTMEAPDDTDFLDDSNDCTVDACVDGASTNTAKADNTPCTTTMTKEPGLCNQGVCNATCSAQKPCTQVGFCADVVCDIAVGQCITTNKPDGLPTPNQTPGDCSIKVCDNGVEASSPDDTDVPDDSNECTLDGCTNGSPSFTDKAQSTVCATGYCDGAGTCVECTKPTECPGGALDNECRKTLCTNNVCNTVFAQMGTALTMGQVSGDCKELQCDGAGNVVNANVNDLPDDSNLCTTDTCVNGVPTFMSLPVNTPCGGTQKCNANGQCGCVTNADCDAPNTCGGGGMAGLCGCTAATCATLNRTCGSVSDGCFATLNCDTGTQNGVETDIDCGGTNNSACPTRCGLGKGCLVGTDCASGFCADGMCCDSACTGLCEACTAAKKGSGQDGVCGKVGDGTDPDNECTASGTTCGLTGQCNGSGACEVPPAGTMCGMNMCVSNAYTSTGSCDGLGACVPSSSINCNPYVCNPATGCASSCANDAGCISTHYCSGGVCVMKKPQGQACGGNNECSNNTCVDGYCCNNTCTGACKACNVPGQAGTCANVPLGYPDPGTCNSPDGCNNGSCITFDDANGVPCSANGDCVSNQCKDGFCCNNDCTGKCKSCNGAKNGGVNGTCLFIPAGTDPDSECNGGTPNCNGAGACQ